MKYLPLVWRMLWRSRVRTGLTFCSIAVAFFLFGLLQTVLALLGGGHGLGAANNLMVTAREGLGLPMPIAHRGPIAEIAGVTSVSPVASFPSWYRDRRNFINSLAATPSFPATDPRIVIAPEQLAALEQTRTGAAVGRAVAEQQGWKLGDRIPLQSSVPRRDGSTVWEVDVVAIWDWDPVRMKGIEASQVILNYEYVDEARLFDKGKVGLFIVRIADPGLTESVAAAIDGRFRNSAAETRTVTENQYYLDQARQLGDIGLIVRSILSAVFFALALVAGNTMMQAFRERTGELAVLKTLGFSDARVVALVTAESLLLALAAGALGLALAAGGVPVLSTDMLQGGGGFELSPSTVGAGLGLALALGLVAALIPAWRAGRLTIVAALAKR